MTTVERRSTCRISDPKYEGMRSETKVQTTRLLILEMFTSSEVLAGMSQRCVQEEV